MKRALRIAGQAWAAAGFFFVWLNVAFAQITTNGGGSPTSITLCNPLGGSGCNGTTSFSTVASNVLYFIYADIALPLSVLMALVGGFQLMTSAGDPEKVSRGRKTLLYAAIGLVVVIVAGGVQYLIQSIINGQ